VIQGKNGTLLSADSFLKCKMYLRLFRTPHLIGLQYRVKAGQFFATRTLIDDQNSWMSLPLPWH
jgi:hypothetical protein